MADRPSVFVSIPTRENIHAETVGWMLQTVKNSNKNGYDIGLQILRSPYPLIVQRNNQIINFLADADGTRTHLFLLDSDCQPEPDTIEKLLEYDKDVVCSVAPTVINGKAVFTAAWVNPETTCLEDRFRMLGITNYNAHGLQEIDGTGSTGVLIKRHVIEALSAPYFDMIYTENGDRVAQGEDYYFCEKIREAGFKIYADFDLRQKHYKTVAI